MNETQKPPLSERYLEVVRLRDGGGRFTDMARAMGVTPPRVRQIYIKAKQRLGLMPESMQ